MIGRGKRTSSVRAVILLLKNCGIRFRFICVCDNIKQQRDASLHYITTLNIDVFKRCPTENEVGSEEHSF